MIKEDMGRKRGWFSSVKKALSPSSKAKKSEKANKSNNDILVGREIPSVSHSANPELVAEVHHPHPQLEDVDLTEAGDEQTESADSVSIASAEVAPEVVRPITELRFTGKSKEETSAIKIQTAFRGYLARRALRALRGLVRLKSLVDGPSVKRQSANTLKCMQSLSRVQSQIQSRRIRMLEDNRALQRHLVEKRAKELESLRIGEEWDHSLQSKEQLEASLLHKYEAASRRERALAYSFSHQQTLKKSTKPTNLLFMDPTNPQWGWSWLDRLMSAGPHDTECPPEKNVSSTGEITKSFAWHQLNSEIPPPKTIPSSPARKLKSASPKLDPVSQGEDSRSVFSVQSKRNRRHSIAGSSVGDDVSLTSSPSVPSYMTPTRSAKAKLWLSGLGPLGTEKVGPNENGSKKRLSFPPSPPRARWHSGPPKVETKVAMWMK